MMNGISNVFSLPVAGAAALGALVGLSLPITIQASVSMAVGSGIGMAFGRAVGYPAGALYKGVISLANRFRSSDNQIHTKSINDYSIKSSNVGLLLGSIAGGVAGLACKPVLIAIMPFTLVGCTLYGAYFGYIISKTNDTTDCKPLQMREEQDNLEVGELNDCGVADNI